MTKVNAGLRLPSIHPVDVEAIREFVQEAERLGFHSLWAGDHVFYAVDVLQPLALLTWISALTSRVRLGTAVMLSAYLNPVLLAKSLASLDVLSGGRLNPGISIGGTEAEYSSIGVPLDQRVGRLIENVKIMRRLWSEDDVSYKGRYYQIEHGTLNPKPVQKSGVPLYFGGTSDAMLKRIASLADGWVANAAGGYDSFADGITKIREASTARGRDPDSVVMTKLQGISVHAEPAEAFSRAERQWKSYYGPNYNVERSVIVGTVDDCAARLLPYRELPAPEVTLILEPSDLSLSQLTLIAEATSQLA